MAAADRIASQILSSGAPADGATVLTGDPGTRLINGTVISIGSTIRVDAAGQQLACDSSVGVAVGESVWVAQYGGENLIVAVVGRAAAPLAGIIRIGPNNDSTNSGLHDFAQTIVSPVNGWVELTASGDAGFSGAAIAGIQHQLYTNTFVMTSGFGWAVAPSAAVAGGGGTWLHLPPLTGSYPVTRGANIAPIWRLQWTPNGASIWYDVFLSYRIYET